MTVKNLLEAASLVEASADAETWKVRLISEGKGSSGIYPASTLEKYGHAFNGVLSYENHPAGWDGPESRNFTQIVGQVIGETWVDTDDRGKVGVYANWQPDPEYRERLARYKNKLGLSIYIEGDGHIDEDGEFVVDSFNEMDPYKSVDVVLAAGRGGRFEESVQKMYDARRGVETEKPSVKSAQDERKLVMDEEFKVAFKTLQDALNILVAKEQAEKAEAVQAEADGKAVESALDAYETAIKAIDEADLLPVQVEALRAEARKGVDIAPMIEQAKAIKDAAVEAVSTREGANQGRDFGTRTYESAIDLGKVLG